MEKALASGCRRLHTPVLAKRELFERSGPWAKISEDMFVEMNVGGESFVLWPAKCPHHPGFRCSRSELSRPAVPAG